jgi:hypothetical protein
VSTKIFVSYSHKDEEWKDRLVPQLRVFHADDFIDIWADRLIGGGQDWFAQIKVAIEKANLAILLISADFLTSSFIRHEEIPRLLKRQAGQGLRIFPVLVRPCNFTHIKWLSSMQIRPKDAHPLSKGTEYEIEENLSTIAREVVEILQASSERDTVESVPFESRPESPAEKLVVKDGPPRRTEYICYLARERLASLFAQVDSDTFESSDYLRGTRSLLSLGEADVTPQKERRRRAAVSQLVVVLEYLERTARIGDLESIVSERGRLDYDWYFVSTNFSAGPWNQKEALVYLTGQVRDYELVLSCSKSNFSGLQREGSIYTPTSTNAFLFTGEAELSMQGLVRLAAADRQKRVLRGSALYLVLGTDLGDL